MRIAIYWSLAVLFFNSPDPSAGKNSINPPMWIIGQWSNTSESNTGNTETFIFQKHDIIFNQGLFPKKKQIDFAKDYSLFKIREVIDSSRYKIILNTGSRTLEYEFRKAKVDSFNQNALSYSIKNNNKFIRQHSDSINRVLFLAK